MALWVISIALLFLQIIKFLQECEIRPDDQRLEYNTKFIYEVENTKQYDISDGYLLTDIQIRHI